MSDDRMNKEEKRLRGEIRQLLSQAKRVDVEEDERCCGNRRGDELPEELPRREPRLKRLQEARQALEANAKAAAGAKHERQVAKDRSGVAVREADHHASRNQSNVIPGRNATSATARPR
jgi:hypothetical protein